MEVDGDYFPRRLDDPVLVSLTVVGEDRRALVQAAAGSAGRVVVTAGERSAGSGGQFSGVWHAAVVASERPDGTVVITTAGNDRLEEVVAAGQTLWLGESEPIPGAEPPAYREEMRPDGSSFIAGSPPTHKTRWRAAGLVGERVETSPADGAIAIARAWRSPYDRREGPYSLPDAGLRNSRPHSWKQAWLRDEHSVVVHLVGGDGEAVHSAQVEDLPEAVVITVLVGDSHELTAKVERYAARRSIPRRTAIARLFWVETPIPTPLAGRPLRDGASRLTSGHI